MTICISVKFAYGLHVFAKYVKNDRPFCLLCAYPKYTSVRKKFCSNHSPTSVLPVHQLIMEHSTKNNAKCDSWVKNLHIFNCDIYFELP